MKSSVISSFWHWLSLSPLLMGGIVFVMALILALFSSSNIFDLAENMFGSNEMNHFNWRHFRYH